MEPEDYRSPVYHQFTDRLHEISSVLRLSVQGIYQITKTVQAVEALISYEQAKGVDTPDKHSERLEKAKADQDLAENEAQNGFPVVHSHALVALWGALESFIDDLTVACIKQLNPEDLKKNVKLKVSASELLQLDEEERINLVVSEYKLGQSSALKLGISKFESTLSLVGMEGEVDEEIRKSIFEMGQCRNLIVHKAGRVDSKFRDKCPWINIKKGERLLITHEMFEEYSLNVVRYFSEILRRDLVLFKGRTREEALKQIQKS